MQAIDFAKKATTSFALPEVCVRIRDMLDDHRSDVEDIGQLVSMDPSLTSKLLKLANSPLFRFRSQVDSIGKAVNVLGGEALYNLVMAETAKDAFAHFNSEHIDLDRFWRQSLYTGLVGKHIAKLSRVRGSERFFLLGLLFNLAELVITKESPEQAAKCIQEDGAPPSWQLQQEVFGFTYAQCSSIILQMWHLPTQLSMPIAHIHDENKALESKEIAIMHTAYTLGAALAQNTEGDLLALTNPVINKTAGIDDEAIQDGILFSRHEIHKIITIFSPETTI